MSALPRWEDITKRMRQYTVELGHAEHHGCLVLSEPRTARPRVPLTDPTCPTLAVVAELQSALGWKPVNCRVIHTDATTRQFDGHEVVRMKFYYQCLLHVSRRLPLNSNRLPSQEPQTYYKLFLKDVPVDSGLGDRHYTAILNEKRAPRGEVLPLPPPERPAMLDDTDGIMVSGKKKKDALAPARRASGGHIRDGKVHVRPPAPVAAPEPVCPPAGPTEGIPGIEPVGGVVPLPLPPSGSGGPPDRSEEDEIRVARGKAADPSVVDPVRKRGQLKFVEGVLEGSEIAFDTYINRERGSVYRNYVMNCLTCGDSGNCQKTAGTTKEDESGEADLLRVASLHVWLQTPWDKTKYARHNHMRIPAAAAEAFLRANREALELCVASAQASVREKQ